MPTYQIDSDKIFDTEGEGGATLSIRGAAQKLSAGEERFLAALCRVPNKTVSYADLVATPPQTDAEARQARNAVQRVFSDLNGRFDREIEKFVKNMPREGYGVFASVQRVDRPLRTSLRIAAFEIPQQGDRALFHGLSLRDGVARKLMGQGTSFTLQEGGGEASYRLAFTFLLLDGAMRVSMRLYQADSDAPLCIHLFEGVASPALSGDDPLLQKIASFIEAEILLDKWRLFSSNDAELDERTIEAVLNPLYAIVGEDEDESLMKIEDELERLTHGASRIAPVAWAVLSILQGLRARQTAEAGEAATLNRRALDFAQRALRAADPHPLAELAAARAERLAAEASGAFDEGLLDRLRRICERIPGNVLARATYVSMLLDDPERRELARSETDQLVSLYPHSPAQSMAMTIQAKRRLLEQDIAGARRALEEAVRLAEESNGKRRAPPFLRYALAVFHQGAALRAKAEPERRAHRALAQTALRRFRQENPAIDAEFDGAHFLFRQLYRAPEWLQALIRAAVDDLNRCAAAAPLSHKESDPVRAGD